MRKRPAWIATGVLALTLAGVGPALANKSGDGNPPNTYGLCTAANNGNKNGWTKQGDVPPPFQSLAQAGENAENDNAPNDARSDVLLACKNMGITPGGQGNGSPGPS